MPEACVIGAGFGGISAALRLKAKGYSVTIIDRCRQLGGRAQVFEKNGYKFWLLEGKITKLYFDYIIENRMYCTPSMIWLWNFCIDVNIRASRSTSKNVTKKCIRIMYSHDLICKSNLCINWLTKWNTFDHSDNQNKGSDTIEICTTEIRTIEIQQLRFGQLRFGQLRFGQLRFGLLRFGLLRLGLFRLGRLRLLWAKMSANVSALLSAWALTWAPFLFSTMRLSENSSSLNARVKTLEF